MKKLLKKLSPFAPDQSGAVSVLFELGGLIAVCDAGGCTGNICGFDEPRYFRKRCALFSAALRDMDAILGRDDRLAAKIAEALTDSGCAFAALIGTPVPAIIGTDYNALKRMIAKITGKPVMAVASTGTRFYDKGASEAYVELFKTFAVKPLPVCKGKLGILGATPLDFSCCDPAAKLRPFFPGKEICCYGSGSLEALCNAPAMEKNVVVAPAGLAAAEFLKRQFGTPYDVDCVYLPKRLQEEMKSLNGQKVLVIHQQFAANKVREKLPSCKVTCASFFRMDAAFSQRGDLNFPDEDSLCAAVENSNFDVIIGDGKFRRVIPDYKGKYLTFNHFAVSGNLEEGETV